MIFGIFVLTGDNAVERRRVATISCTRDVVFVLFVSFLFLNLFTSNFSGYLFHKTCTLSFKTQGIKLYPVMPMPEAKLPYANVFYCE